MDGLCPPLFSLPPFLLFSVQLTPVRGNFTPVKVTSDLYLDEADNHSLCSSVPTPNRGLPLLWETVLAASPREYRFPLKTFQVEWNTSAHNVTPTSLQWPPVSSRAPVGWMERWGGEE